MHRDPPLRAPAALFASGSFGRVAPLQRTSHRYLLALGLFLVTTVGQRVLRPHVAPTPFLLYFAAVVASSWFCGAGPSLLLVLLADLAAVYFFLPPFDTFRLESPREALALVSFTAVSIGILSGGAFARRLYVQARRWAVELAVSEERFRSLAETVPDMIWTLSPDGRFEYVNPRAAEYTGLPRDVTSEAAMQHLVHPDDLAGAVAQWSAARADGRTLETQARLRRHDGVYRWFLARVAPVRTRSGAVLKWVGSCADIDAQHRSADRARFLASASQVLGQSLDYEETLRNVTRVAVPAFADWAAADVPDASGAVRRVSVFHQDPSKIETARRLFDLRPPQPEDPAGVARVLRTGEPELLRDVPDELLARTLAGEPEVLKALRELGLRSSVAVPIGAHGRVLGVLSFAMAESGRRYDADDLDLARELATRAGLALENARLFRESQEANRLKDEFLSTLSHELRTPLTSILGWARLLPNAPTPERVRHGAQVIERNALAQAQLVDDLLDMSRLTRGKLRLAPRPIDAVAALAAAVDAIRPAAEARRLRLRVELAEQPAVVRADPDRLQQVLWNLLSNALKFTPEGGELVVRAAREGEAVLLSVRDTGRGIDPRNLDVVFERFRQLDASHSRSQGGLGLGLAISRELVLLQGGTLTAHSEGVGKGATFVVRLPLAAGTPRLEPRTSTGTRRGLQGLRVLLVEDAVDTRDVLSLVLEDAGAKVSGASTVDEALAAVRAQTFDVIVSDIGLPGRDGYALVRELRESGVQVPALALTAYARTEDRARSLDAGFDEHLSKPVDAQQLLGVLERLTAT